MATAENHDSVSPYNGLGNEKRRGWLSSSPPLSKSLIRAVGGILRISRLVMAFQSWIGDTLTPGSRGSGHVRGFFDQAGLKPMSSR
jgi:hypothetical protein